MLTFEESGMKFSFEEDSSFYIEKSKLYEALRGKGISVVECLTLKELRRGVYVLFIEAKTSAPNPKSHEGMAFNQFIGEIAKKFLDSLLICSAIHSEVQSVSGSIVLGKELQRHLYSQPKIQFILIIKNHQKEWCNSVQEALQKRLHALLKIWKAEVLVLNEEQARIFHLCQS